MQLALASILLSVLVLIFSPALSFAQQRLDLGELLAEAMENNPELKAMRERVNALDARAKAEGALDDPTLKVELEDLSTDRPLSISPDDAMLTRYTFSQMFPFPGKRGLRERIAGKEASAARAELSSRELEIASMLKEAFFEYAFLDDSIRVNRGIKDLLADAVRIAETRYSVGQAPQQDILKLNVEQAMITNEIIGLEAERSVSAAMLKSLLSRPQTLKLSAPGEMPKAEIDFDLNALTEKALGTNPDVLMFQAEAEAGELGEELAGKNYYPDFMVGVAPIQRDNRFDNFDLMFQVNIPLWRGKYGSLEREARANAKAARLRLLSMKNGKAFEIKRAAVQVEAAQRTRELYDTTLLPQVELSYQSALRNYQAGTIDLLTLLDTERELRKTRVEYLRAILEYNRRIAALERAAGVELRPTGVAKRSE
ncbi:MAG TPA: TolC family protein [Thermodesulfobacteriota bacterium]